jgi:hypothetical protein
MQKEIYVLASLLDPDSDRKIRQTWEWLGDTCDLKGINLTPLPHISWQGADCYDFGGLETKVKKITRGLKQFSINASGLGIFTGINPILYLTIVKNITMLQIHKALWENAHLIAENLYSYYSPEEWVPHITLAARDINMKIDSLALLYVVNGEVGIKFKYEF